MVVAMIICAFAVASVLTLAAFLSFVLLVVISEYECWCEYGTG
jgi:hypothetical protein